MTTVKAARTSRSGRKKALTVAGVGACALSAALLTAGPASAASRGFTVTNLSGSTATLRLEGVNKVQYAAQLTFKIEKTNAKLEFDIQTTSVSNNSKCKVVPATAGTCTAGGLNITFKAS